MELKLAHSHFLMDICFGGLYFNYTQHTARASPALCAVLFLHSRYGRVRLSHIVKKMSATFYSCVEIENTKINKMGPDPIFVFLFFLFNQLAR